MYFATCLEVTASSGCVMLLLLRGQVEINQLHIHWICLVLTGDLWVSWTRQAAARMKNTNSF